MDTIYLCISSVISLEFISNCEYIELYDIEDPYSIIDTLSITIVRAWEDHRQTLDLPNHNRHIHNI